MSGPKFDAAERARLAALEELAVENPELVAVLVVSGERRVVRLAEALKDALSGLKVARQHYGMNTGHLEDKVRAALREAGVL